jgi:hypothetical protein
LICAPLSRTEHRCAWALGALGALGGLLRLLWMVVIHPPMQSNYRDMAGYIDRARNLFGPRPESIADTLFPPGTHILFSLLARIDPSFNLAAPLNWLRSLGTMGLVWLIHAAGLATVRGLRWHTEPVRGAGLYARASARSHGLSIDNLGDLLFVAGAAP